MYHINWIFYLIPVVNVGMCIASITNLEDISYYEIVELRHIDRHGRDRRDLSTFIPQRGKHLEYTSFTFSGHRRHFLIHLYKNTLLIPNSFTNIYQNTDRSYRVDKRTQHCYYHGYVAGRRQSSVSVSTCYGLKGVINDDGLEFVIEPHPVNNGTEKQPLKYILYKSSDVLMKEEAVCGVDGTEVRYLNETNFLLKSSRAIDRRYGDRRHGDSRLRRSTVTMKYVEVVVVIDKLQFKKYGDDINKTQHRTFEILNIVDSIYKKLNTRVAIVHMVTWNVYNMAIVSANAGETLNDFEKYTRDVLHGEMRLQFDNAQLLTQQHWGTLVGLAGVGVICSLTSAAVNRDRHPNPAVTANTLAHEMGHNIGFMHNKAECTCERKPCVMNSIVPGSQCEGFTNCSQWVYNKRLSGGYLPCLLDYPSKLYGDAKCGNGYVEEHEECDCGTEEECKESDSHKCCDFATCKLHKAAQCATGPCCEGCKFKRRGLLCRDKSNSDCDLAEYCTGETSRCPKNFYLKDGVPCRRGSAFCYEGMCKTHDAGCEMLWGPNAKKANDVCFNINLNEGSEWGNCGKNLREDYVACAPKDKLCGKLQCAAKSKSKHLPNYPVIGTHRRSSKMTYFDGTQRVTCILGSVIVPKDLQDPSMTGAGVKCAANGLCVDHKCTNISSLTYVKSCKKSCANGGTCNNNGHCHCPKGFACPYCELAGPGGSADSGQGCVYEENCEECFTPLSKGMLVLFLMVLPFIGLISFLCYRHRDLMREKCLRRGSRNEVVRREGDTGRRELNFIHRVDADQSGDVVGSRYVAGGGRVPPAISARPPLPSHKPALPPKPTAL